MKKKHKIKSLKSFKVFDCYLRCKIHILYTTHLAGDVSLKKKMHKEFCPLRFKLLIKISYIPDFENF